MSFTPAAPGASDAHPQPTTPTPTAATKRPHARRSLRLGFLLTLGILAVEVVGGALSHSLALFSDAGHVLTDVAALGLAWFAAVQAERPANARRTFGYHRVGILTALINSVTLIIIALVIGYEALQRFATPKPVAPQLMIGAALVAIALNLYIGVTLNRSADANLNTRAALLHVLGDVGASVGVVLGALAIIIFGPRVLWLDPLISLAIAALVGVSALRLIGETLNILLEATPRGISLPNLVHDIRHIGGVHDVHDLHVWTISSGMLALSCHIIIDDLPPSDSASILDAITAMLRGAYHITHSTIQFESEAHTGHDGVCACAPDAAGRLYCELRPADAGAHHHTHHHH